MPPIPNVSDAEGEKEPTVADLLGGDLPTGSNNGPKTAPRPRAASGTRTGRTKQDKLEKKLLETLGTIAMVMSMFNAQDGFILAENAESLAFTWAALAEENPKVARVLEAMLETNAWGAAIIATASCAIPILDNHGYIPNSLRKFSPTPSGVPRDYPSTED